MKKLRFLISLVVTIIPFSLHADHHVIDTESVRIPAGEIHESCMELTAGTSVEYTFESNTTLSYNVHFHDNGEVIFPVEEHETDGESNTFTAELNHVYCLMWTNPGTAPASVQYSYEIQDTAI